jgi:hypothetical protein
MQDNTKLEAVMETAESAQLRRGLWLELALKALEKAEIDEIDQVEIFQKILKILKPSPSIIMQVMIEVSIYLDWWERQMKKVTKAKQEMNHLLRRGYETNN